MTALRIFATAKPSLIGARVLPMSDEDARFWQILAARRRDAPQSRLQPMHNESWVSRLKRMWK